MRVGNGFSVKPNLPILFMVAGNALAAVGLLSAWPWQTGPRGMLFFLLAVVHVVLAAGLWRMKRWARVLMIGYAAFQFAALSVAALTALALVMADGLSAPTRNRLLLAAIGLPVLLWAALYLLRPTGQALFARR